MPIEKCGLSGAQIAAEMGWTPAKTYKILKQVEPDIGEGARRKYSLSSILRPLFAASPGASEVDVDAEHSMTPLDQLNSVKAKREQLRYLEEMSVLGKMEDWDNQTALAMKNLSNSLDGLPDLLTDRLNLDDSGFELCERVVDGFRTSLYNTLILGTKNEEDND